MKKLLSADQVEGGRIPDRTECKECIQSKHQVKVNRTAVIRTTRPFERVHTDLCGPFGCNSWGGSVYFIVYMCDATRYPAVFFLTTQESVEVIARWRYYRAWVRPMGYEIREFGSDNGTGEFANAAFEAELAAERIEFQPALAHTQHKNGVAEGVEAAQLGCRGTLELPQ